MLKKGYVDTTGGQIHYRISNDAPGVPIVLFHATPSSSAAYEPLMRELEGTFPLIAFDTVNYGESYRTDAEPSISLISKTMIEALDGLGIDRFHVYGIYTGANIAVDLALKHPGRVMSVMAHSPNYISMEANAYCRDTYAKSNPIHVKGTQIIWAWNKTKDTFGESIWLNPPHSAEILHRDTVDCLRAGENWHWASRAVYAHDLIAALKQVECPLFLLWGTKEPMGSFAVSEQAAADLPHARRYAHAEGGSYALESYPADFAREVTDFVREAEKLARP